MLDDLQNSDFTMKVTDLLNYFVCHNNISTRLLKLNWYYNCKDNVNINCSGLALNS